jgi:hypothetical protein
MLSTDDIYDKLVDEEDARACLDISDAACRETPRNFLLILLAQFCTKLGDAMTSPKTVLAWIMGSVGAPVALTGLIVPIRESGSLIPQLVIAHWVRQLALRKWVWIMGSAVEAASVVGMGLAALTLDGVAAGVTIVALLLVFSLARGFCSVASKDVLGKTVARMRRGQLTGWSASAAGLVAITVGLALMLPGLRTGGTALYATLLVLAGGLWLVGAAVYAQIRELPGETEGGRNALADARRRLALLADDAPFRRFVLTRSLLLCSALSAPYYVLLAREQVGDSPVLLGAFIVAAGLADLASAPVWGRLADRSSRRVMSAAGLASGAIGLVVFAAVEWLPVVAGAFAFLPLAYFCLSVAHAGVRVGRKTFVVDLAGGNRRTDYVSVSNTVIGVVLLVMGLGGTVASLTSLAIIVLLLSVLGLAGAWLATSLPESEQSE